MKQEEIGLMTEQEKQELIKAIVDDVMTMIEEAHSEK